MTYSLRFASYSGMSYEMDPGPDREAVRQAAAGTLRRARRKGEPVVIVELGDRWEFLTPDDAATIGDKDGILYVKHITYPCRECGSPQESPDDAAECCSEAIYQQELARQLH